MGRTRAEGSGRVSDLIPASAAIRSDVLLLGGGLSAPYFKTALHALHEAIPHAQWIELPGLGHLAADNDGRPDRVAKPLADFFTNNHLSTDQEAKS